MFFLFFVIILDCFDESFFLGSVIILEMQREQLATVELSAADVALESSLASVHREEVFL